MSMIELLIGCGKFLALLFVCAVVLFGYEFREIEFVPFRAHWMKRVVREQQFMQVGLPLMVLMSTTFVAQNGKTVTIKPRSQSVQLLPVVSRK